MKSQCLPFFLLILLLGCNNSEEYEKIQPQFKDITEYVYGAIEVSAQNIYQCKTPRSGIIKDVFIKEGDKIKENDLLFTISPTADLNNRLSQAKIKFQDAQYDLNGFNNSLKNIEIQIKNKKEEQNIDPINYKRNLNLWEQGIGSKVDLEKSFLKFQNSQNALRTLELNFNQTKNALLTKLKIVENNVSTEMELLSDLNINSKIEGIVYNVYKENGELITSQEVFAEIGSSENYEINMSIDEKDISKIAIGDTAIIQLEAYKDKVFRSLLTYISESKDKSTQTFKVNADFIDPPKKLFNGLSGEANILIERRKKSLIIPSEYIVNKNKVLTENGLIDVEVGVKTLDQVEILRGIDSTIYILKPDNR